MVLTTEIWLTMGGGFFLSFSGEGSRSFEIPSARTFFRYALVSRYFYLFIYLVSSRRNGRNKVELFRDEEMFGGDNYYSLSYIILKV